MKLEYSPSRDKFYIFGDIEVSYDAAYALYCWNKDVELGGMNKIIEFNWDMKRVHDYYGNGHAKV
jgi:hypothetical protein